MIDKVYIVIVTYNGMSWINECLESTKDYNIIIVDNNSTDETLNFIESKYPSITILKQKKNRGFGKSNNIGISYALKMGAESVFLLNQDAYLERDTIEKLVNVQQKNPEYGILSPIHLNGKGDRLDQNFSNYVSYRNNADFYSDFILNKPLKDVYELPFVNAAGWLVSKKCLLTVGGFDPIFFHYGEDDNYCQRVLYHGLKIGVVMGSFIKHDRENKKSNVTHFENKNHFLNFERNKKVNWANINKPLNNRINIETRRQKHAIVKSFLKLNFTAVKHYSAVLVSLKKINPEVLKSREINKNKGKHYLD